MCLMARAYPGWVLQTISMAFAVTFCRTVGGNNSGGKCLVLRMPILSSKSCRWHNSHSYNLICLSSMLCTYRFNLWMNVILPMTSGAMKATFKVCRSWPVRSLSIDSVLFHKLFMVMTISCSFPTLYLPYIKKSCSSCQSEFHANVWLCLSALKLVAMALLHFFWRKELRLSTAIVTKPAKAGTRAGTALFLHTGTGTSPSLVSHENLWPAETGTWLLLLDCECPDSCKDLGISSFNKALIAFS